MAERGCALVTYGIIEHEESPYIDLASITTDRGVSPVDFLKERVGEYHKVIILSWVPLDTHEAEAFDADDAEGARELTYFPWKLPT